MLERRHDVLAPTLAGHAGGPPLVGGRRRRADPRDAVERAMDEAGFPTAHIVGNSLGGYVALQLAARGRARSVVGARPGRRLGRGRRVVQRDTLAVLQATMQEQVQERRRRTPRRSLATAEGRRSATQLIDRRTSSTSRAELIAHQILGVARLRRGRADDRASRCATGYRLDAERITCPVRIVWGTADKLLPWPSAAARFRDDWLPHADWVELDGVGHCPQLDVPLETAQLILGFTRLSVGPRPRAGPPGRPSGPGASSGRGSASPGARSPSRRRTGLRARPPSAAACGGPPAGGAKSPTVAPRSSRGVPA